MKNVVICGSYHRDSIALARVFRELETCGCRILSPLSIDFVDTRQSVVRAASEASLTTAEIERFHLRAIHDADFVWLHAPEGHVGVSASFELGFTAAINIPIFSNQKPHDEMLQTRVNIVQSVFEALELLPHL